MSPLMIRKQQLADRLLLLSQTVSGSGAAVSIPKLNFVDAYVSLIEATLDNPQLGERSGN